MLDIGPSHQASAGTIDGVTGAVGVPAGSTTWAFGEGTTRPGFQHYLTILNPATDAISATVTYDTTDARTSARARIEITSTLQPGRTTIDVNAALGPNKDVGARVSSGQPVVAERPLYFSASLPAAGLVDGGSSVPGLSAARTSFIFAEGTTRAGFQEYLTLANPSEATGTATVTYDVTYLNGSRARSIQVVDLPPGRSTIDVNAVVATFADVSVSVATSVPAIVERPTYFTAGFAGVGTVDGGTVAIGPESASVRALFAEGTTRTGFQEYLTVLNPGADTATATITYDTVGPSPAGGEVRARRVMMAALAPGRSTIDVNAAIGPGLDASISVEASSPVVSERPLYVRASVGRAGAIEGGTSVPAGLAGPVALFAEGTTRDGFQQYLTILNPSSAALSATVIYDTTEAASGSRKRINREFVLGPGRTTIDVNTAVGGGMDVSARIDAGGDVLVERPIYFRTSFPTADEMAQAVASFISDPRIAGYDVGVSIFVEGFGEVAGQGADRPLLPASNQKIYTAAAAFEVLGMGSVITTTLVATTAPSGPVLTGTVWVVGAGDPLLTSIGGRTSFDEMAAQLHAKGVRTITGGVAGDESRFDSLRTAPGWRDSYLYQSIGPLSALTVDGNFLSPSAAYLADPIPLNTAVMRDSLTGRGIAVSGTAGAGTAPAGAFTVAAVGSRFETIAFSLLTFSDNTAAELLLKEIGRRRGGPASATTAGGSAAVAAVLTEAGLPPGLPMADGSGLSISNRQTARGERELLAAILDRPWSPEFVADLPLAARTGTLAGRFGGTAADGRLRAKTGTLNGARALAGYVTTNGGRRVVFAVLVNGGFVTTGARDAIDDLLARITADIA